MKKKKGRKKRSRCVDMSLVSIAISVTGSPSFLYNHTANTFLLWMALCCLQLAHDVRIILIDIYLESYFVGFQLVYM